MPAMMCEGFTYLNLEYAYADFDVTGVVSQLKEKFLTEET